MINEWFGFRLHCNCYYNTIESINNVFDREYKYVRFLMYSQIARFILSFQLHHTDLSHCWYTYLVIFLLLILIGATNIECSRMDRLMRIKLMNDFNITSLKNQIDLPFGFAAAVQSLFVLYCWLHVGCWKKILSHVVWSAMHKTTMTKMWSQIIPSFAHCLHLKPWKLPQFESK